MWCLPYQREAAAHKYLTMATRPIQKCQVGPLGVDRGRDPWRQTRSGGAIAIVGFSAPSLAAPVALRQRCLESALWSRISGNEPHSRLAHVRWPSEPRGRTGPAV